jgi:hypothetical protein
MHADAKEEVTRDSEKQSFVAWKGERCREEAEVEETGVHVHLHVGAQPSQVVGCPRARRLLQPDRVVNEL